MAAVRIYESVQYPNLSTKVKLGEKYVHIEFSNALTGPIKRNGRFATDDPAMQKAIESDSGYGSMFVRVDNGPAEEEKEVKVERTKVEANSVQEAREYLIDKHGVSPNDLPNKAAVLAKGKELNISFSNVK